MANADDNICPDCLRSFATLRGLNVHRQRAYKGSYEQDVRAAVNKTKVRWSDEEVALMASYELNLIKKGVTNLNQGIQIRMPQRSIELSREKGEMRHTKP